MIHTKLNVKFAIIYLNYHSEKRKLLKYKNLINYNINIIKKNRKKYRGKNLSLKKIFIY